MYQEAAQRAQPADYGFRGKDCAPRPAKWQFTQEEIAGFLLGLGFGLVIGLLSQPHSSADSGVRFQQNAKPSETSRRGAMVA